MRSWSRLPLWRLAELSTLLDLAEWAVGDWEYSGAAWSTQPAANACCSLARVPRLRSGVKHPMEPQARGSSEPTRKASLHGRQFSEADQSRFRAGAAILELRRQHLFSREASINGPWCNGSTAGFDPVSPSSNLGGPVLIQEIEELIEELKDTRR